MSSLFGIYGASGFGREVMPLARQSLARRTVGAAGAELVFIDDQAHTAQVNGHRVMSYTQFASALGVDKHVCIAIASGVVRQRLAERCAADGILAFEVVADNASILDENEIGPGAILCGFVQITSNARIGRHFHANIYSYVAHDCVVGDYVTLAPGAKVNGNVVLEDHVYVGTGAIVKQGTSDRPTVIGRGAVIGMGAVVTKSVAAGSTVVGNPARPMEGR